jgi:LysM repeat protein/ABC-type branched-subunit amino acid transport system substrate-binding protein
MANKRIITLIAAMLITLAGIAQPVTVTRSNVKVTEGGQVFYVHTVAPGHTLFSIARAYDVTQEDIIRHNPSSAAGLLAGQELKIPDKAAAPHATTPKTTAIEGFLIHTVAAGETLFGISRKYGVPVQSIINANPQVQSFDNLQVGQELRIPAQSRIGDGVTVTEKDVDSVIIHNAQKGESLFGIAQAYKVHIDSIVAWNPELNDKPLRRGQDIRIIVKTKKTERTVALDPATPPVVERYDTVLHQIQDKETIWGLAKRYNTTVEKIIAANPELSDGLKRGYYIYIPVPSSITQTAVKTQSPTTITPKGKGCENSRYKAKYKIALMIPLYLDEIDRVFISQPTEEQLRKPMFKSFRYVEFYEGFLIALDSMKKAGMSVDLYVFDTAEDTMAVKKILAKPEMQHMDLIIGPFFAQNYDIVARFAIQHKIKIVSPFARNQQLIARHDNIFQMNASSESKMSELARFVARTYPEANVIMVIASNETDRGLSKYFKQALDANTTALTRKPVFAEVVYQEKGFAGVSTRLDVNRPNIVINLITGETMVSNYISSMAKLSKNFDITMIGRPEWNDYRTFDLADLMAVKMHMFDNAYVNYDNPVTKAFLKEFRDRYKGDPEENNLGFVGYDVGIYFLKALHEYGLDFENCLGQLKFQPVSTGFKWEQVNGKGYENIQLNLYRFVDFKTEPVK